MILLTRVGEGEVLFLNCAAVSLCCKRSILNVSVRMFAEQSQEKQRQLMTWQVASKDDNGCRPDILFYFIIKFIHPGHPSLCMWSSASIP